MQSSRFALKTRIVVAVICSATLLFLMLWGFVVRDMTLPVVPMHFMTLHFNIFGLLSALAACINAGLFIYFISKPARTPERLWLTIYIGAAAFYAAGTALQEFTRDPGAALFWANSVTVAVGAPAAIFLFALYYTSQSERSYVGISSLLVLGSLLMLYIENFSSALFINDIKAGTWSAWGWDYRDAVGPVTIFIAVWYYTLLVAAIVRLVSFRRHAHNPTFRSQSLLYTIALSIIVGGGVIFDFFLPLFRVNSIPPLTPYLTVPVAMLLVYGALRYRLLTVNPALFSSTILNIMNEAVIVTDKTFAILFTNPKAEALFGTQHQSGERSSLVPHIAPSYVNTLRDSLKDTMSAGELTVDHIDIIGVHGSTTPVRVTASRINLGDFEAWVLILSDISAELRTRNMIEHEVKVRTRELNEARAYLVSSIASLEQGFMLVDQNGKIVLANDAIAKLLHTDHNSLADEVFGDAISKLPLTVDLTKGVTRVLGTHHMKRYAAAESDGSFFDIYLTPIINGDTDLGATVIIQDVTEAKILERSKDEFFSIASHELRTPLTAIRGNMSLVKEYYADQIKDPNLHEIVYDTHAAAIRLIEIVNDFLDTSRLEQGKMIFAISPTQVAPIIDGIKNDLQMLSSQQHNTLVVDPSVEQLPLAMCDGPRLRQILYNLTSNANKYSKNATITLGGHVEGNKVKVRVSDTGKGISPEGQKLLFHKFQQAGDSILTRDNTKGTGLGLYISKLLATSMHGNVELESSEVGKGSTFAVTMPLAPADAKVATPPAANSSSDLASA